MINEEKNEEIIEENEEVIETTEQQDDVVEESIDETIALQEEIAKLKTDMLRVLADTENTKRRLVLEAEKNSKYFLSSFAKSLLPVADNLQRAMQNAEESPLLEGVKLTYAELLKSFEKFEVTPMECLDQPFNANYHQVISEIVDETKDAGTVVEVLQTGYMIADRILREAMVIVSKK